MLARTYNIPSVARMDELISELMRGVNAMFLRSMGSTVLHGPFKGMVIPTPEEETWADGNFSTKVLGVYEHELHDVIMHAVSRNPSIIVNIGCADGYYAIGFARLMSNTTVHAFDVNEASMATCFEFAERNYVRDRVDGIYPYKINGHCLYVIDCEGDELTQIDLQLHPEMMTSDIIVECHDFLDQNISLKLADRLAKTHAIEIIRPRLPLFGRYEFLNQSPGIMQVLAVMEKRPMPTLWLACWAHRKGDCNG